MNPSSRKNGWPKTPGAADQSQTRPPMPPAAGGPRQPNGTLLAFSSALFALWFILLLLLAASLSYTPAG